LLHEDRIVTEAVCGPEGAAVADDGELDDGGGVFIAEGSPPSLDGAGVAPGPVEDRAMGSMQAERRIRGRRSVLVMCGSGRTGVGRGRITS
jgi:hypothetical protein